MIPVDRHEPERITYVRCQRCGWRDGLCWRGVAADTPADEFVCADVAACDQRVEEFGHD